MVYGGEDIKEDQYSIELKEFDHTLEQDVSYINQSASPLGKAQGSIEHGLFTKKKKNCKYLAQDESGYIHNPESLDDRAHIILRRDRSNNNQDPE